MQRKRQTRRQSERHRELDLTLSQARDGGGGWVLDTFRPADAVVPDGDENADNLPPGPEAPPRAVTNQWRLGKTCNESWIKPISEQQEVVVTAKLKTGDKNDKFKRKSGT